MDNHNLLSVLATTELAADEKTRYNLYITSEQHKHGLCTATISATTSASPTTPSSSTHSIRQCSIWCTAWAAYSLPSTATATSESCAAITCCPFSRTTSICATRSQPTSYGLSSPPTADGISSCGPSLWHAPTNGRPFTVRNIIYTSRRNGCYCRCFRTQLLSNARPELWWITQHARWKRTGKGRGKATASKRIATYSRHESAGCAWTDTTQCNCPSTITAAANPLACQPTPAGASTNDESCLSNVSSTTSRCTRSAGHSSNRSSTPTAVRASAEAVARRCAAVWRWRGRWR